MDDAAQSCGAQFLIAILPGPAEAYYGLREPATEALLAALRAAGLADKVIDTRPGIPLGCDCFLSAYDYPGATGATLFASAMAQRVTTLRQRGSP
jgi:hypothetical protein